MKGKYNITDNYPMQEGKYLNLENNKLYSNPRTINNYLNERGVTAIEYCIKWNLVNKIDYVECKICNKYTDSIGKHLSASHKEYGGIEQYKKQYGENVKIIGDNYKTYLSNKFKGENNINHKSKTTELERQQKSPFSIEFWRLKYPMYNDIKLKELMQIFFDSALSDREFNTRLEYYTKRGFSEDEGLKLIKERQTTFSLDICKQKHGNELGLIKWKERQEKWLKNCKRTNFSQISQKLFKEVYDNIKHMDLDIYFAILNKEKQYDESGKNYEYYLKLENIVIKPDFFIKNKKKIIEFDGTYYHRNTTENKTREILRDFEILNSGYEVLHISEFDYKNKKEEVIKKCIDFILS